MRIVLGFVRYALGTIGWDVDWPLGADHLLVTDHHGRRWQLKVTQI